MGLFYKNKGKNNKIIFVENGKEIILKSWQKIKGIKISFAGDNNTIKINKGDFNHLIINVISNNSNIVVKENASIRNSLISVSGEDGQYFEWGSGSTAMNLKVELTEAFASALVGEDCMFAANVQLRPTDGHAIFDKQTGKVTNKITAPLTIGKHCWIGEGVRFTKNSKIANNTIVGMGSIVTKKFNQEDIIIAGSPAKIIKENVRWDRASAYTLEQIGGI